MALASGTWFDPSPRCPVLPTCDLELLDLYLELGPKERERRFADTYRTAQLVGVTRRTIQLWIDAGSIRAIQIGRKYQVALDSVWAHLRACTRRSS